jgi:hypothetical protein
VRKLPTKPSPPPINEALRAHLTRIQFDLSLGKTHIACLVWVEYVNRTDSYVDTHKIPNLGMRRTFGLNMAATVGLLERGLIWHRPTSSEEFAKTVKEHGAFKGWAEVYGLTRAGELVRDLLKEAGIWQEYAAMLPAEKSA